MMILEFKKAQSEQKANDDEILTRGPESRLDQRIVSRILVSNKIRGVLMVE